MADAIGFRLAPEVPSLRQCRSRAFGDPLFLSCQKKWAKRGAGYESDCIAVPQKYPVEKHCGQHTRLFLQSYTTAPPAWNNAPIENRCRARRWKNTLLWNAARIYVCADSAQYSRSIVQYAVQYRNRPSIPEMSRTEVDAVCPQLRVVHLPEPKAIGTVAILRPKRAFRPRSGQKFARVSAQYSASSAHLFAYFFWQDRKSRPLEAQLQCYCNRGSPVNTDKRAGQTVRPPVCFLKDHCSRRQAARPTARCGAAGDWCAGKTPARIHKTEWS